MLPLLQIKNLTVDFPGTGSELAALDNFSLDLQRGEMLAVVGESGSGKSVMSLALMNLLSSAARVSSGSILFSPDGREAIELVGMAERSISALRGNKMAMIFQEPMTSLNPVMTCGEQLSEPLILHKKMNHAQAKPAVLALLERVRLPDPESVYRKYPHQLSGGQKQRVMIAMAISCHPALLICDEPTTALDVRVQKSILAILQDLQQAEDMGMIFITHDLGLVSEIADRVIVMLKGKLVEQGTVNDIFTNPKHAYTRGLLMCRPALHVKGERLPVVSDFMTDGEIEKELTVNQPGNNGKRGGPPKMSSANPAGQEILLEVRGLNIRYSSGKNWLGRENQWFDAVSDVGFQVFRGETLGVVGESGSGKTTLGRAILGLNKPVSGSIRYGAVDLMSLSKADLRDFRRHIQIVFQDPYSSLNPRLMVGPAVEEPIRVHSRESERRLRKKAIDLLGKVDLREEHFDRYPHAFSGGQRQRIVIARALALNPGFVVFDESVSALDVSVQAQVLNLINDLKAKMGFTAVFISHDLAVVRYLCDRVIVMEKGRIVESGDVEQVYLNPRTDYTRALIEAIPGRKMLDITRTKLW